MFNKILIANRGEIAVRIHRTCREMGISTVAVHSEADADALHVKLATESVCIGGNAAKDSYLNIPAILSAAEVTDCEAIHPGYGFLSENSKFAEITGKLGFTFIGPKPEHIIAMGDKITAIQTVKKYGLPTVPGSDGVLEDVDMAVEVAERIGYPVIVKATSGGGGKGMKVAHSTQALRQAFHIAMSEAQANFGDNRVYLEKFLEQPRHVEVQVLCDSHGNVSILGERDCSLQRRHQKIIEETPSPAVTDPMREKLFKQVADVCKGMGYLGAGTFEFLYEKGEFYFIEMNTRLQVEHPVTEMVTGIDLVAEQIRIAFGEKLRYPIHSVTPRGHSIECRINAEDPEKFYPSPGKVTEYFAPGGPGVRVDSALYPGYTVPPYYDPTVGKLIVHGATREECVARLKRALEEFVVGGIKTNIPLHRKLVATNAFLKGEYTIHSLEHYLTTGRL
ncbi:MAG: acetyl-CoA carboxylase biotin carboxylase subunit [Blastochloris viridis]|uniref:Biotin carboxylase n=1 Tax=Blastochloris viridis TaxID=1079 RepID=A0A6N4RC11_BLAVI|nr:MAG: acetyl-CoA carboxylase biotin carboxylase subunit [Blastochloris viridis]